MPKYTPSKMKRPGLNKVPQGRHRQGRLAQGMGSYFEQVFFLTCNRKIGMAVTRMPDGCKTVGKNKLIRVKTPWDYIVSYSGHIALLDTKTTQGNSFPHSKIEPHQVDEMFEHAMAVESYPHGRTCVRAGYVIWFRGEGKVFFIPSVYLSSLVRKRGSLDISKLQEKEPPLGIFFGKKDPVSIAESSTLVYLGSFKDGKSLIRPELIFGAP